MLQCIVRGAVGRASWAKGERLAAQAAGTGDASYVSEASIALGYDSTYSVLGKCTLGGSHSILTGEAHPAPASILAHDFGIIQTWQNCCA